MSGEQVSEAEVSDLMARYKSLGESIRRQTRGEPDNTGKTVQHFLSQAMKFATSGRVLGLVSIKKRPNNA